eukprot:TRINITY_DN9638_c0_g1_i4.p1 TRINITY_DN9638_c0_g1~~TRINITY_DN9638_c0_g1_i4.p1  ORF type:complete len:398 (+),score=79.57 TRINITY_DN9638_c0_g1_i4:54-1247(+)
MGIDPEEAAADGPCSSQPGNAAASDGTEELRRLHILPMAEAGLDEKLSGRSRLEFMGPELRKLRSEQKVIRPGDLIRCEESEFVVIKCEPSEGILGMDTDFFIDGNPIIGFQKIQFSAWGPTTLTSEELFSQCVKPFFKGEFSAYGAKDARRVRLLYANQVIQVGEVSLQVEATEPAGLGVVSTETEIFANWDQTPEFEKVHILPFQDTLPRAYSFDLFADYLKPYLVANNYKKFQANELFTYQGVQFKMVACEPSDAVARIGKSTTIFCEGVLNPSLRNLLPPNLLNQVSQLPPGLQMLLLNTERTSRELEDMLSHRRGLFPQTLAEIERFSWPPPDGGARQQTCMVCLADFQLGDECRRLPCQHVFHQSCIDEWLRRCTDCPICKANVDRAIRNY